MTEDDEQAASRRGPQGGAARGGGEAGDEGRGAAGERAAGSTDSGTGGGPGADPGTGPDPGTGTGTSRPQPARRLTRSRRPKVLAGVCSGLGRYFDLDPVVFRIPLAVISVVGGLGLVLYGAAWLLIPAEDVSQNEVRRLLSGRVEGSTLAGILVALLGCGLFLASLGGRSTSFSLLLVGAVAGAAYWSLHRREAEAAEAVGAPVDPTTAHAVADAPPEAQAPPVPATPSWWREPLTKDGTGVPSDTGYLWGPSDAAPPAGRGQRPDGTRAGEPAASRRPRRERSFGGLVTLLATIAAVAGAAPGWDSRPLGTSLTVGLACALAVYGIGLAVTAFAGRTGLGTVFLTVVTAVLLAAASVLPKSIGTKDWRDVTWAPADASDVATSYELDGGSAELDLGGLRFGGDQRTVRTTARIGAGTLKVVVPSGTRVELDADIAAGELRVPVPSGRAENGYAVEHSGGLGRHERLTLLPSGGREDGTAEKEKGDGTLRLSAEVGAGQLEIVRVLPSGARTDHAPGQVVPRDERHGEHR
ncbi:PspC domain-containing protein [Streptomyces sp. Amel2xB2]|uniref:PspC domain-containing protein n=1 Tax=Streptomyces sp. Amel2xB2 TaxID=1305829 RepID=UPI000DB908BA|nr:PspC domain-containing protein [Streptomyces sp. Amel2xB2]